MNARATAAPEPGLGSWLAGLEREFADRAALRALDGDEVISFADLNRRSARLAGALRQLGLRPGDSLALWLPNRPLWLALHFAAARLGLLTIPLNTWYRASELTHFLRQGRCRAIVMDSGFRNIDFRGVLDEALRALDETGDLALEHVLEAGSRAFPQDTGPSLHWHLLDDLEARAPALGDASMAENARMIAFSTSGTTSAPKLAVHRESSLLTHSGHVARKAAMSTSDIVLGVLPPCGAYGYTLLLSSLSAGATALLMEEFDLDRLVSAIRDERVTLLAVTEPILRKLFDHSQAIPATFKSLRLVFSAGTTLQPVVDKAERVFHFRITNVYGSSEILALAAFWGFDRDVAGRSLPGGRLTSDGMEVRAVDATGAPVAPGIEGELQFRGPIVTRGYLGNEQATRRSLRDDGWFASGDLGSVVGPRPDEFLYVARMSDALRIKGFLVSPGEIEAMLQTHPSVATAQVVGLPDGLGEEIAAAFVVLRQSQEVSADELRTYCRDRMASYKTPAIMKIVDSFPMTRSANGDKVMKTALRQMAQGMAHS